MVFASNCAMTCVWKNGLIRGIKFWYHFVFGNVEIIMMDKYLELLVGPNGKLVVFFSNVSNGSKCICFEKPM